MATVGEMIVKLIADTGSFNTNMAEAATTVKASQDAMASSMASSMNAFRQFDDITKQSVQSTEGLAQAQAALAAVQGTNAFTSDEVAAKQALVSEAMAKVAKDTKAAAGAMGALSSNSRTAYTASALISDALTGQFSRSRREVAALANETGLMSRVLSAALSPAGILAGAIATLGIATIKAQEDLNSFDESLERTNDYMGIEAGELQAAAQKIESLGVSYGNAKDAVIELANSGRFTSDQLLQAATAAAEFAQITGEKVSEVDKLMVEMATNPQKALDELVDKYHRVTPAQAEVIEQMIKAGDKAGATAALVQAMGTSVAASFDKQAQHAGMLDKVLITLGRDFGQVWRGIGESLNLATGGGDAAEKLTTLQHELADMRASGETTGGYAVAYQALEKQAQELQTIIDKQHQSAAAAKQMADAYAAANPAQGSFAAFQKSGLEGIDVNGNLTKQLQTAEAAMKTSYGNREQFEEEYWGTILQKAQSGSTAYIEAWQHVQTLQQQLDQRQLQASEETDRKSAESAKEAARKRADAIKQADNDIAQGAKEEADERMALDEQTVENAHDVASKKTALALQGFKTEFEQGQITAAQLLRDQINALNAQLAADSTYFTAKAKLAAGDAAEQAKWNEAIRLDKLKTEAEMLKDIKAFNDAVARLGNKEVSEAQRRDQEILNSSFREINGILFQHESLKTALGNIGMEILQHEEENVAKGIAEALNGEQGKTAAAEAGAAERLGITIASEAQSLMVQGEAAVKWIMTEAAKAAAGAFNAMVSIPYVGPFLAIGASVAAFAAVSKLVSSVASAEGGWERVPADGMMTELHKDEMVLPAHVAEPMRKMTRGGMGGAVHNHYNVQAWDSRDLGRFVRRHGGTLSSAMSGLQRNGYR